MSDALSRVQRERMQPLHRHALYLRFRVSGFGFRFSGFRFQVPGSGFRVSGFGVDTDIAASENPSHSGPPFLLGLTSGFAHFRNVQRFQGGHVFKAHRLLYPSTLGLRVIKKKTKLHTTNVGVARTNMRGSVGFRVPDAIEQIANQG